MNGLDLLLTLFFGGIVALAFLGGLGRMLATVVGLYAGLVAAAFFYHPLTVAVVNLLPSLPVAMGELIMFVLLLVLFTTVLSTALARSFVVTRFPHWLGPVNNIAGGIAGLLVATVATVLLALVLNLATRALDQTASLEGSRLVLGLNNQLHGATLPPLFLKLAPTLLATLQPWFPRGLPPLLTPANW